MSALRPKAALAALVILCVASGCLAPVVMLCADCSGAPAPASPAMLAQATPLGLSVGGPRQLLLQGSEGPSAGAPLCRQTAGRAAAYRVAEPARVLTSPAAFALEMAASAKARRFLRCVMDKDGKK